MIRRISRLIPALVLLTAAATMPQAAAAPTPTLKWETVEAYSGDLTASDNIEVSVSDRYLYIYTPAPVNAKLFTILGQLVTQSQLPAGVSRIRIATRGIYILRAGAFTRRITI